MSLSSILSIKGALDVYYDHAKRTKGKEGSLLVRIVSWISGPDS